MNLEETHVHAQVANSRGVDRDCVMRKSDDKIVKGIKRIAISYHAEA